MRERIQLELKNAIKRKEHLRTQTLRLMSAAIKDRDIAMRNGGEEHPGIPEEQILAVLQKMVNQRKDSIRQYEEAGRLELAEREEDEMTVINEFLPRPLSVEELNIAIQEAIDETQAVNLHDMSKVIGQLKHKFAGRIDFSLASKQIKEQLT